MKLKRLMLCVGDPEEFAIYSDDIGRLVRQLGAELLLFHSVLPGWSDYQPYVGVDNRQISQIEELALEPALKGIKVTVSTPRESFSLMEAITREVSHHEIDAVIVPGHSHRGLGRWIFGSVAEMVIRSCRFPVISFDVNTLADGMEAPAIDQIVVPVDFSQYSKSATLEAITLATELGVGVTLLHALEPHAIYGPPYDVAYPPEFFSEFSNIARKNLDEFAEWARDGSKVSVSPLLEPGTVVFATQEALKKFGNPRVFMATAGRDSLGDFFIGSRTERVLRHLQGVILTLPVHQLETQKI